MKNKTKNEQTVTHHEPSIHIPSYIIKYRVKYMGLENKYYTITMDEIIMSGLYYVRTR